MDRLYFTVKDPRVKYLSRIDSKMNELIRRVGTIDISLNKKYYKSLVQRIIGQQLSLKAAHTILERVSAIWQNFDPTLLPQITDNQLRSTGVSRQKINYIRDLAQKYLLNDVDFEKIRLANDEEVIQQLKKIKGVGQWTAEMFLIFSLGRLNILSYSDVSIKNSICWLYRIEKGTPLDLSYFYNNWSPYNTIASLYLWKAIDLGLTNNI